MKNTSKLMIGLLLFSVLLSACSRPSGSAPTPFTFPTPDLTLTAIFGVLNSPTPNPDQATASAVPPTATLAPPTSTPTNTPTLLPTDTPFPTNTPIPTNTAVPTITPTPLLLRPKIHVKAVYTAFAPVIDGDMSEWDLFLYPSHSMIIGEENWTGKPDCRGDFQIAWDNSYLYVVILVKDDVFRQVAQNADLYKGDHVEILFDNRLQTDFYSSVLNQDDYQLGITPGTNVIGLNPVAYLWYPQGAEGLRNRVTIASKTWELGYVLEMAIPWEVFGVVAPQTGAYYGFAISVSDNDTDTPVQQTLVSNVPTRKLTNPTTWGDLELTK